MKPLSPSHRRVLGTIAAAVLLGVGGLWWLCCQDSNIPFLPAAGSAEWIVYPKPPDTTPHHALPLSATFSRSFTLDSAPASAMLSVRAFKLGTVHINGLLVDHLLLVEQNWKRPHRSEVAAFLHAGTNEISVTVSNSLGPPALWLSLKLDSQTLDSDADWQVSQAGAAWQKAMLASQPPAIRPGNQFYGRERMVDSLHRTWPVMLLVLLISAAAIGVSNRFLRPGNNVGSAGAQRIDRLALAPLAVLGVILVAWLVLFSNNLPQLAALFGFDRDGHQQYIDYILQQKALPLADDGWQMYQPPLFYLLSALIIGPFGWTTSVDSALLLLRSFSVLTGMLHVALIFLCLRLLFPNQPRRQIGGLLLAGFLPANLCLSHHVTNEGLAALFVTAALYFTLRLLRSETRSLALALGVGACLGLALLTKFSALLAVPVILGALLLKELQDLKSKAQSPRAMFGRIGLVLLACLVVCGWHYARVWQRFGNPLIGNWDPRLPFAWWQDPGCHTGAWYGRVGEALICPLFGSLTGFADGLYGTLWGDGLCSGSAMMKFRPQWNYDLMNAGYLFSLLATALLVVGAIIILVRFIRQPTSEGFLMLGMAVAFGAGIALMTLRVASYAQVKAFYALPALLPLCVIALTGGDFLLKKSAVFRPLVATGLLAWAIVAYSAFWIRSGNAFTYSVRGVGLTDEGRYEEAAQNFSRALQLDAESLSGRVGLAEAWRRLGRREEAAQQAALALQQHPDEAEAHIEMAVLLSLDGKYPEAIQHLSQAVHEAPDHPTAFQQLAACWALKGQPKEVIEACQQGLRVDPFNPEVHRFMAIASAETGDLTNALTHAWLTVEIKPKSVEARSLLALVLASLGRWDAAAAQYEQATREKPDDAKLRVQYATALSAQGEAAKAADQYRQALTLQPDMVEALNNLAWMLAASPDNSIRNGAESVRWAEHACELTQRREPVLLGTLAAAYAEAGRFDEAVKTAHQARDLALAAGLKDVAAKNAELLELYRDHRPYRETGPANR